MHALLTISHELVEPEINIRKHQLFFIDSY
jgi:hypothetical protein